MMARISYPILSYRRSSRDLAFDSQPNGRVLAQGWFSGEGLPHVAHGPWVATGSERLAPWSGIKATVYPSKVPGPRTLCASLDPMLRRRPR